ncbi:MAG: alpha/beta hydrolase [Proteobacteria bacterium]|nr:alpha/beta hydrolase [Pseudomonadota bacterium]
MADRELAELRAMLAARPRVTEVAERRKNFDMNAQLYPVPADVTVEPTNANGVRAEWTSTPDADRGRAVLYFHGGGYVFGSLLSHRHMVAELGRAARMRTLALDYRLAPEHPFPAPVEDAVSGYRYLLGQGLAPRSIAIAGDSAGGGLVAAALVAIRDAGLPQPSCGWCISPWVDMEAVGGSMTTKAASDPTVQRDGIQQIAAAYLGGADPRSPLAAPIYAELHGLAPLFIQVGAAETLLDDAVRLAAVAGAADVPVRLDIWPEMVHVWHLYFPRLSAGRRAIEAGAAFLRASMS